VKRIILAFALLAFGNGSLHAQKDSAYINTFGGIQNDVCNQIKPTWDGGYILVGTTNSFGPGGNNIYVIKTDSLAKHKWSNAYGGSGTQEGFSITPTLDKGYAILGFTNSYGTGSYDVYLIKTDSTGKLLWQKTYGGTDWDFGYAIAQTSDSGFVMCGLTYSYGVGNGDAYVVRTDKNGDTLWTRAYGGAGYDVANSIYIQEDSLYVIGGLTTSFSSGDTDSYFLEVDNKGILLNQRTYGIKKNDAIYSVRGTSDMGYVMFGYTDSIPDSVTAIKRSTMMLKTDSVGKMQWIQIYYNAAYGGTGKDALQCPDGNYLSVATSYASGYPTQMNIQEESPGGWWADGLFFEGTGNEQGNSIAYHNKYNFAFAGSTTYGAGLYDVYMVRFRYDSLQVAYKLSQNYFTDTLGPDNVAQVNALQVGLQVYPNPMVTSCRILIQSAVVQPYYLSLSDELGRNIINKVETQQVGHGLSQVIVNRGDMSPGSYIFRITDGNGNNAGTGKIIVE
jgi:hypothetical protein